MIPRFVIEEHVRRFLMEDLATGDVTSAFIPDVEVKAEIITKQRGIVAGVEIAQIVFEIMNLHVSPIADGSFVEEKQRVMGIEGKARSILMAERTALNILMKMSGIATVTKRMLEKARKWNSSIKIAATRKTTPGFRLFEKLAVAIGGGDVHRYCLGDAILIKNNHIKVAGSVKKAIRLAKSASFIKKVEVEVRNIDEAIEAAKEGVDVIMFDNMKPDEITIAIKKLEKLGLRDKIILEASGDIKPENVEEFAKTGVDVLSSGYIIHSAKPLDMSLSIT
jgi:nicotinate-nucleotide pyrophosphorylase (carboxylating)